MYTRIRDLREDRDLKQREVAEYLNCSQQVYSNYELGRETCRAKHLFVYPGFTMCLWTTYSA